MQIVRGAVAADPHRERFSGVLVNDVRQLQPASVGGLVELEVNRPHVIRSQRSEPFGAVGPDPPSFAAAVAAAVCRPSSRHNRWIRLRFTLPTLPAHRPGSPSCTPTWMRSGDLPEPAPQLRVIIGSRRHAVCVASNDADPPPDTHAVRKPRTGPAGDTPPAGDDPGSEVSLRQLLEHRLVQLRLGQELLQPGVLAPRAPSTASLRRPSCRRTGPATDSSSTPTSRDARSTSVRSLPSLSSRSPSRNFRTICSGV